MLPHRDADALRAEMQRLEHELAQLRAAEASHREIVHRTNTIVLRWDKRNGRDGIAAASQRKPARTGS